MNNQDSSSRESHPGTTDVELQSVDVFVQRKEILQQTIAPQKKDVFTNASDALSLPAEMKDSVASEADTEILFDKKEEFVNDRIADSVQEDEDDEFLWTEERDMEISEALDNLVLSPLPCIHSQLDKIKFALETGTLAKDRAIKLLDEIDLYIRKQLAHQAKRPEINHYMITMARTLIKDGLHLFEDVTAMYRQFLTTGDSSNLMLASRLSQQAAGNITEAKDLLLQAEPMPDDENEVEDEPTPDATNS